MKRLLETRAGWLGPPVLALMAALLGGCPDTTCSLDSDCQAGQTCQVTGEDGTGTCVTAQVVDAGGDTTSSSAAPSSMVASSAGSASGGSSSGGGSSSAAPSSMQPPFSGPTFLPTIETVTPLRGGTADLKMTGRLLTTTPQRLTGNGLILQGRFVPTHGRSTTP